MEKLSSEQERLIEKYFDMFVKSVDIKKEMASREKIIRKLKPIYRG